MAKAKIEAEEKAAEQCELCEGTGCVCSGCGHSVSVDGATSSSCQCPYNGGKQPAVRPCECRAAKPAKGRKGKR